MKRLSLLAAAVVLGCTSAAPTTPEDTLASEAALSGKARYIVAFRDVGAGKAALAAARADVVMDISGMKASAAMIPQTALTALQANPNIEYIEEDVPRYPMSQTTPYGITNVQAPQVWAAGNRGGGTKVCIIDSGFYTSHEDHQSGKSITGYGTTWNQDGCGHGTHVAGTIAAVDNMIGVIGVNPDGTNIYIVRVFDDTCTWAYASGLADAVNKCSAAGAKVINMSLGGGAKSRTEETALNNAYNAGVLSIAAAGNGGNSTMSYPASYPICVSVAAVDQNNVVASFSQYNREVDIAAPGVGVLSTVPWLDLSYVTVGGTTANGTLIEFASRGSATGALVFGGLCDTVGAWSGKVVLCDRGTIDFNTKVSNVKSGGGAAAVIANNVSGGFSGTLGTGNSSTLVAIGISMEDGTVLKGLVGQSATVSSTLTKPASGYEAWDGTSMATPHVVGVAALIWNARPTATPLQIRTALLNTALDLGTAGRDNQFGYGLVQAKAAQDYLLSH